MPIIPWTRAEEVPPPPPNPRVDTLGSRIQGKLEAIPAPTLALSAFLLGSFSTVTGVRIYTRYVRRLRNADWITPNIFAKTPWVKGRVTSYAKYCPMIPQTLMSRDSVGDADNFRLYHTPGIGWRWPFKFRRIPNPKGVNTSVYECLIQNLMFFTELKDETLHIRIAGVDAPEVCPCALHTKYYPAQ